MSLHNIRVGDTRPHFQVTIEIKKEPIDLTGSTVRFQMMDSSGVVKVNAPAVILQVSNADDDPTKGVVEYRWVPADTSQGGDFFATWEVTFPDGTVQSFPTLTFDRVRIRGQVA